MKKGFLTLLAAWLTLPIFAAETRYIVTLRAGEDGEKISREFKLKPTHIYRHAIKGFAAPLTTNEVEKLKRDKRVRAVEPDGEVKLLDTTVIPAGQLTNQIVPRGILRMGLTNFPMTRLTGQDHRINVDVAVLDSGIQLDHPDLNVYLPGSVSFADGSTNGSDWNGHGTHVAGIVGALDNDFGVVGVAPGVRLWSVEVVGIAQHQIANLLSGLDYISEHADQISVVNASIITAADTSFSSIHQAVLNIVNQGVVFVAGAGNNTDEISGDWVWGNSDDYLPAGLPEVMAVSAMNPTNDLFWEFSNFSSIRHNPEFVQSPGFAIDVAAPGVNILSTYKGGDYAIMTGTSMASPHSAALAALYIAANGRATNAEGVYRIRQAIVDHSQAQADWSTHGATGDVDGNPEPLAFPSEAWIPQPQFLNASVVATNVQLSFNIVPGYAYTVQYCTSLMASNIWIDLMTTNASGSLSTVSWSDSAPGSARFYRLDRQPTP